MQLVISDLNRNDTNIEIEHIKTFRLYQRKTGSNQHESKDEQTTIDTGDTSCRDLGVTITNDLIPSMHINETVRIAHQRANAILRCFTTRDNVLLVNAFKTYVRPIVEIR